MLEAKIADDPADIFRRCEGLLSDLVLDQFISTDKAGTTNFANQWVLAKTPQPLLIMLCDASDMSKDVVLLVNI